MFGEATQASMSLPASLVPQKGSFRRRKACENCRRRKERCDGVQPCGRCRRRRVEGECQQRPLVCHPPQPPSQNKRDSVSTGSEPDGNGNYDTPAAAYGPGLPDSCKEPTFDSSSPSLTSISSHLSISSSLGSTVSHTSRLVRNHQGAYIFLGPSANLSLLQCIRKVAYNALGPNHFAEEPPENDLVDEDPSVPINWIQASIEPPRPSKTDTYYYLRWYASATSCVLDLFGYEELATEIIPWLERPAAADATSCINFLVLAIGAQCGPQDRDTQADAYFTYGRYLASAQHLESANISTVQIYCLIAAYLLNATRPTAASMHLGVAIRTAHSLGIHRADISILFSAAEKSRRERVWKVLRVLDLFLSTCLGQQPSTTESRDTMLKQEYSASTDLCYIFEKILSEIYTKQEVSPAVLQHVSRHHREWASHFREGLEADRIPPEEHVGVYYGSNKPNIGLCHLKEAYYWTIMLVTRPYLIDMAQRHSANDTNPLPSTIGDDVLSPSTSHSDTLLAHASVNSAVLTIDLLQGFLRLDEIPKRLPYIVNSVFNSALLLGLGFFADLDRFFPLNRTMRLAEELLDRFQAGDTLARWCLHILQDLRNACDEFVKRRCERRLNHQKALVEGLFGDVKPSLGEVRSLSSAPSLPQNLSSCRGISPGNEGLHELDRLQSLEFTNNLQIEENNPIWSQLFCNGTPGPAWEPGIESGELPFGLT
ncbi:hypothetical protein N7536_003060 [Penicillium majusculum]|nr:hypothetical protein N7536_003060 [Penicillium majusculum]